MVPGDVGAWPLEETVVAFGALGTPDAAAGPTAAPRSNAPRETKAPNCAQTDLRHGPAPRYCTAQ
jgi:hypothetical protein